MDEKKYKIIYEDDHIIAVDKPSGMLVIETPKKEKNTLTALLNKELDSRGIEPNAYPCHRLDRETSGVIIYAKGKKMQGLVMDEFKARAVKKCYVAIVQGNVTRESGTIKGRIYNRNKKREEPATTHYKVVRREKDYDVVEAEPVTGRTNQIRIQFKGIGHPLVGESVFAFRKDFALKFHRAALHASYIRFKHPATGEMVDFVSPLAEDMKIFLEKSGGKE